MLLNSRGLLAALLALASAAAVAALESSDHAAADRAPTLSLRDAISRTLASSPEMAAYPLQLRAQQARVDAAGLRPAPHLGAEVENVFGSGQTRGVDVAESTFTLSQVLELGGQRRARVEAASTSLDAFRVQQSIAQLDLVAEVGRRFIHVASDQKQLALTHLATALAERTVTEVQRRVQAARSPEVELHRARIALSRAKVEEEHAEHELLTSRRKLAAMWGARSADDFGAASAELFRLPDVEDQETLVARLAANPDFLRFASEARQRDAELRLAQARARASLTASAGVRLLSATDDTAFVAGLSLPLSAGRQAQPHLDEARALREVVDVERKAAQVKAEASLFELVQELRHSITEAEMLRDEVLPQMDAALKATEYAWQRGRYSYLEWTEAQRERITVERALITAAANAHLFQVEIERLTGAAATPARNAAPAAAGETP